MCVRKALNRLSIVLWALVIYCFTGAKEMAKSSAKIFRMTQTSRLLALILLFCAFFLPFAFFFVSQFIAKTAFCVEIYCSYIYTLLRRTIPYDRPFEVVCFWIAYQWFYLANKDIKEISETSHNTTLLFCHASNGLSTPETKFVSLFNCKGLT